MLSYFVIVTLAILACANTAAAANNCTSFRIRPECHDVSPANFSKLVSAIKTLHNTTAPGRSWSVYEEFARAHLRTASAVHGQVMFMPYHRQMLYDLETKLLAVDPTVQLCYWNFTIWSQRPAQDPFLGLDYVGDTDRSQTLPHNRNISCIRNGNFAGWSDSTGACVTRQYKTNDTRTMFSWYIFMERVMTLSPQQYGTDFRNWLEGLHSGGHVFINGTMFTMSSPMDPVFFFLHGFVDHVWHMWQEENNAFNVYWGSSTSTASRTAGPSDVIPGYNVTVRDVLHSENNLCVRYLPTGFGSSNNGSRSGNSSDSGSSIGGNSTTAVPPPVTNITTPLIDPSFAARNGMNASEVNKLNEEIKNTTQEANRMIERSIKEGRSSVPGIGPVGQITSNAQSVGVSSALLVAIAFAALAF